MTKTEGLPFLRQFEHPSEVAEYIDRKVHRDTYQFDPSLAEIEAYSWILGDQSQRAFAAFDRLEQIVKGKADASADKVIARARKVRTLVQSSPNEAKAQLAEWREFTLSALKLNVLK